MEQNTGLVEAIIVEIQDRDKIGGRYLNSNPICCTRELYDQNLCKVGEVIIRPTQDNSDWPKRVQTFFEGSSEEATMITQTIPIRKTGMYYLYFMFCDPQLVGMVIKGRTVWRNPYGYLPGKMAPLMTFYGFMSLAYLLLGLIWFLQFVRHWRYTLQLHYHITAVIALGMCEMAFWYFEYANFNSTGTRPMGVTIWAVTFTAVKKTVSRLLLLVVSMGFGVVRSTLGGITSKVAVLGVVYFVASVALELVEHLGNINDFAGKARLFLVLPVALLDATFIVWIFSSLSRTLEKLQVNAYMIMASHLSDFNQHPVVLGLCCFFFSLHTVNSLHHISSFDITQQMLYIEEFLQQLSVLKIVLEIWILTLRWYKCSKLLLLMVVIYTLL
ncbi:hypothetical protein B296_00024351 [Ensete ventricosum]|uniref:GOST seven transmembrane domain-containing protein n=1 Tax=Ensete ventricosum TaxID=4639 RepID=A0A427AGS9_ENSVE|nr:hypothetical protein B296_00024351 [Ensete ventricosum]